MDATDDDWQLQMATIVNESLCIHIGLETVTSTVYRGAMVLHMVLSITSLVATAMTYTFLKTKVYFHPNLNMMIFCMCFFANLLSLQMLIMQFHHLLLSIFYKHPCDVLIPASSCSPYLMVNVLSSACMTGAQICICLERMLATLLAKRYKEIGPSVGYVMLVLMMIFFAWLTISSYAKIPEDELLLSCISSPAALKETSNRNFLLLIAFNFAVLLLLLLIYVVNRKYRKSIGYDLGDRYQMEENMSISRIIGTIVLVQFIVFTTYASITLSLRLFHERLEEQTHRTLIQYAYLVPFFTAALPFLLRRAIEEDSSRRSRTIVTLVTHPATGETGGAIYFTELRQQWA